MQWPSRAQEICEEMWARNRQLAQGNEEDQRLITRMVAEQIRFELGEGWGCKRGAPGHPQGTSQIAFNRPDINAIEAWRWIDGDGRGGSGVVGGCLPRPVMLGILQNQPFIPVDPIDHLGVVAPEPQKPTPPAPPSDPTRPPGPVIPKAKIIAFVTAAIAGLTWLLYYLQSGPAEENAGPPSTTTKN